MRIRQLDLIAFGHFTNRSIDLSQGNLGLHMIYGPNEAGKSTSLRALTAFMFGFPQRTDDNFLHENKALRVGATLENRDGKFLSCVRRKAKAATLAYAETSDEVPLSLWHQFLPRIPQDQFLRMFGLDHYSLREGGQELVQGGGDSGQALFSSASGIANLQQKRIWLDSKIEEIYAKSGRKGHLFEKLKEYKSLKDQEKQNSLSMDHWRRIDTQLGLARGQIQELKNNKDTLKRKLLEAERIGRSIPVVRNYLERNKEIEALGQKSRLPEDLELCVQEVHKKMGQKRVWIEGIEAELKNYQTKLQQIPQNPWCQQQDQRVDKLTSGLDLYQQAIQEIPRLKIQREQLANQASQKWQQIGSIESLRNRLEAHPIPTSQKKWIETLAKRYEDFDKQISDGKLRLMKLQKRFEPQADAQEVQIDPESLGLLAQRVQAVRPLASRMQELEELEQHCASVQKHIEHGIRRWNITVESIEGLVQYTLASTSSIDRWGKELDKRREAIEKSKSDFDSNAKKHLAKQRDLDRKTKKSRIPSKQDWESSKQSRDQAFDLLIEHRTGTTERWNELVQAYLLSKESADEIAAGLLDQAELVAQHEQLHESIDELKALMDESAQEIQQLESQLQAGLADWKKFLDDHKISAAGPAEAMEWVQAVAQLQHESKDLLDKKYRIEQIRSAIEKGTSGLIQGLKACGVSPSNQEGFDTLIAIAESVLQKTSMQQGRAEAVRKQRQVDQQDYNDQSNELQGLEEQFAELKKQWWEALASISLPPKATTLEVQIILEQISDLQLTTDQIESIQKAIDQFEQQVRHYEASVAVAWEWLSSQNPESLDLLVAQSSTESKVRFLERYGNQVSKDQANRASIEPLRDLASERLKIAQEEYANLERQMQEMIEHAEAGTQERLLELARNSRQFHLLDSDRKQLRDRLQDECNNREIEPFIELVKQADADELTICIQDLKDQISRIDLECEEAIKHCSGLERDYQNLDTGGKASMLASQASGVGVLIEESVQELAILRLASAALTAGIDRYRSANEDPILKLASESFRDMTSGRYRGIEVSLDDDGKHLLVGKRAVDGPGSEVSLEQMSDGTRDQLYLALRLASLQQWNTAHEPIPLIVDDILVHFDDQRSIQTLKQLVRLSDQTQVIFFTHHEHLMELAQSSLPGEKVFFHQLQT
ncbi:MAG: AAA family ATPase [Planctomycetota bacterium]|jgi:uncharacterized protein YhaN